MQPDVLLVDISRPPTVCTMRTAVLVPDWVLGYQREWLRWDLLAGVTVTAYLVPQVMAYAEVAGLPPETGLLAAAGAMVGYAFLGSSRVLSVGPESTTALMTAAALASVPAAATDPQAFAATLAILVAVLCVVGRIAHLGALATLLSRPVLVGYMAGIAAIMVVSQLGKLWESLWRPTASSLSSPISCTTSRRCTLPRCCSAP